MRSRVLILVLLVLGACAPGEGAAEETWDEMVERIVAMPHGEPVLDQGGRELLEAAIRDGVITFAEYEQAMVATVGCIRDEGLQVEGPYSVGPASPGEMEGLRLGFHTSGSADPRGTGRDIVAECQAEWSFHLEGIWLTQSQPTERERQEWLQRAWDCARDVGMPLSRLPTETEALLAVTAYGCRPWEE